MELMDFFRKGIKFSPEIEKELNYSFKREHFHKGHHLLLPYNESQKIIFIEKGLIRSYYIKDDKDITHHFFPEDTFNLPLESIFYKRPSPYGWEALEETTVRCIQYQDFEPYMLKIPGFEGFIRELLIEMIKVFSDRLYAIQFQTAQDRYTSLISKHPDILKRAPLGHIASYLGITQQTLSVIRAKKN